MRAPSVSVHVFGKHACPKWRFLPLFHHRAPDFLKQTIHLSCAALSRPSLPTHKPKAHKTPHTVWQYLRMFEKSQIHPFCRVYSNLVPSSSLAAFSSCCCVVGGLGHSSAQIAYHFALLWVRQGKSESHATRFTQSRAASHHCRSNHVKRRS